MSFIENAKTYTGRDLETIFFRPMLSGQSALDLGVRILYNMPAPTTVQLWERSGDILQQYTAAGWTGGDPARKLQKTIDMSKVKAELGYSAADYFSMIYELITNRADVNMDDLTGTELEQAETELFKRAIADDHCCGQTYIDLYNICPSDPNMIRNIKASIDMVVNTPQVNDWWWIDAVQMAMPIFAKFGKMTGEQKYYDKMWDMYYYTRSQHDETGMFNQKDGLWWRDQDFNPPYKEPNGEDCYWSRGNGWVYAALVRVLDEIPSDEKHRQDYVNDFLTMSKALKKCQREDGFWNVSLHDPTNFGGKETSGTALFVYGMAWGVRNGLLDRKEYLPILLKAWNAMVKDAVHPNGFLGYVQGTGKEPKDGQPVTYKSVPDFEDYGVGCFLLAGTEVYKLK